MVVDGSGLWFLGPVDLGRNHDGRRVLWVGGHSRAETVMKSLETRCDLQNLSCGLLPLSRPHFLKFTECPKIAHQLGGKQSTQEPVGANHAAFVAQAAFPNSVPGCFKPGLERVRSAQWPLPAPFLQGRWRGKEEGQTSVAAIPLSAFSPAVSMWPHHPSPPTPGPLTSVGSQVHCTEPDSLCSCCGPVIRGHQHLSEEHVVQPSSPVESQ